MNVINTLKFELAKYAVDIVSCEGTDQMACAQITKTGSLTEIRIDFRPQDEWWSAIYLRDRAPSFWQASWPNNHCAPGTPKDFIAGVVSLAVDLTK